MVKLLKMLFNIDFAANESKNSATATYTATSPILKKLKPENTNVFRLI
jgi:hypothetical protein